MFYLPLVAIAVHNSGVLKGSDILDIVRGTQTFEFYCLSPLFLLYKYWDTTLVDLHFYQMTWSYVHMLICTFVET